jgi:RNA polymerase sigma-70 factor (ECF subfamily)
MQMTQLDNTTQIFNQYRGLLFSIAYRMLSSATDAEDIVQEAFVRWMEAGAEDVQSPRAYLCSIVVRLCIDQLRSARAKREIYVGPWLPEPVSTAQHPELVQTAMLAESLSFAFLVMLENLKPLERAVVLLREVFEYDYEEIAAIVGKSAANCRQVLHRAHERLGERRPRFAVSHEQQERITHQFLRASTGGDMQGLLNLLTTDIVLTADGGGKAQAGLKPVYGADRVSRGFMGSILKMPPGVVARVEEINGQPALVGYLDGRPYAVVLLEIEEDRVGRVYIVMNPDKLGWLPPESA